jgi:parallel beta-helix repeat protein
LVAKGQSRLEASLCFFTHCQRYGLLLLDSAEVILDTCTIDHNQTGLFAGDSSHPKLSSCFCLSNRTDGLLFAGKSVGRVDGGTYEANGQAGIVLAENSRGVVNRAICRKNLHGIEARDSTHLKLKNNTCEENRECGILIGDSSEAGLIGNICTGNVFGIRFTGYKEQKLEGNRCSLNTGSDIAYEDAARPNLKSR